MARKQLEEEREQLQYKEENTQLLRKKTIKELWGIFLERYDVSCQRLICILIKIQLPPVFPTYSLMNICPEPMVSL